MSTELGNLHYGTFGEAPRSGWRYAALIGDVVGSRNIRRRAKLQDELSERLDHLNERLAPSLAAPLVLIKGDEIQGLFTEPAAILEVVIDLAASLHPIKLAYGLGYGPLSTRLVRETAQLDGACFHQAREALEAAQKDESWLQAKGFGALNDATISALFHLMHAIRDRWTKRQNEFVHAARSALQKDVAKAFGVSPSVVSESLKAACFSALLDGEHAAAACLEDFGGIPLHLAQQVAEPGFHDDGGSELR